MMTEHKNLEKQFKNKVNLDESNGIQNEIQLQNIVDDIKKINFTLNTLSSDVLIVKKIARPESLT